MKTTEVRTLDAGRRVQGFLDTNAPSIGTAVPPSLRAKVDAAVSQLVQFRLDQEAATAAAKGETVNQAALRSDLFKHLVAPIGKVAKINLRQSTDLPALVVPAAVRSCSSRGRGQLKDSSHADAPNPPIHQSTNPPIHQSTNPPITSGGARA